MRHPTDTVLAAVMVSLRLGMPDCADPPQRAGRGPRVVGERARYYGLVVTWRVPETRRTPFSPRRPWRHAGPVGIRVNSRELRVRNGRPW
jgi:hypothetical protein